MKEPEPPKETVKEVGAAQRPPEFSFEPAKERKPKKPAFEFTPVKRPTRDPKAEAKAKAQAEAREQERQYAQAVADRQRRLNAAFGNAAEQPRRRPLPAAPTIEAAKARAAAACPMPISYEP